MAEHLGDRVLAAVCAEIVHKVGSLVKRIESVPDISFGVCPSDMGDDEAQARELTLYLHYLPEVHRVLQPSGARNVAHDYRAHFVQSLKLSLREKVEYPYLPLRNVIRRKVKIRLHPEEVTLSYALLNKVWAFPRVTEIQRRIAGLCRAFRRVCVVRRRAAVI